MYCMCVWMHVLYMCAMYPPPSPCVHFYFTYVHGHCVCVLLHYAWLCMNSHYSHVVGNIQA